MQLEHTFTVPVDVDEAWKVLLDIEQVASCMPGAALHTVHGDNFTGTRPRTDNPGYHVVFVPFPNGVPNGTYEIFASGFTSPNPVARS